MTKVSKLTTVILFLLVAMMCLSGMTKSESSASQDLNFRLLNIERRLDDQQQRINYLERAVQNLATPRPSESLNTMAVLQELQRQQINTSQQILLLQKQMLDTQKTIDALKENIPVKKDSSAPKNKTEKSK